MPIEEKDILKMIDIVCEEITQFVKRNQIDTIVNPANPTLMGGVEPSVDYSIHEEINKNLSKKKFKDKIRKEIDKKKNLDENIIRCERGAVVATRGYSLCRTVIHVVGPEYDGIQMKHCCKKRNSNLCTSSCVQQLETCYHEIMKEIRKRPEIERVAIPIISSGNYGMPFKLAVKIALATVASDLVDWKNKDLELFEASALKSIYFCVFTSEREKRQEQYAEARKIWNGYKKVVIKDKKVVYQNSAGAHFRYLLEIMRNDNARGYFAVAKLFRLILLLIRTIYLPVLLLKDVLGGCNWQKRRTIVEMTAFLKLVFPFVIYSVVQKYGICDNAKHLLIGLILYFMSDTITYLLLLIVLSDVQRPSANVIRSMIFLLINYLEVMFDVAVILFLLNHGGMDFAVAVQIGMMTEDILGNTVIGTFIYPVSLQYLTLGVKFFFMTLAFGYFANHLRQREFLS